MVLKTQLLGQFRRYDMSVDFSSIEAGPLAGSLFSLTSANAAASSSLVWAKLAALAEGARLATGQLWGRA
jgi:hypothetical protein